MTHTNSMVWWRSALGRAESARAIKTATENSSADERASSKTETKINRTTTKAAATATSTTIIMRITALPGAVKCYNRKKKTKEKKIPFIVCMYEFDVCLQRRYFQCVCVRCCCFFVGIFCVLDIRTCMLFLAHSLDFRAINTDTYVYKNINILCSLSASNFLHLHPSLLLPLSPTLFLSPTIHQHWLKSVHGFCICRR